ncbi:LPXTG cell wall anchor domain-containing protein, partial [Lactiplantibacillus paraplantarum]
PEQPEQPNRPDQANGLGDALNPASDQPGTSNVPHQESKRVRTSSAVDTSQQGTTKSTSGIGWVSAQPATPRGPKQGRTKVLPQTDEQDNQLSLWGVIILALSSVLSWVKLKQRD